MRILFLLLAACAEDKSPQESSQIGAQDSGGGGDGGADGGTEGADGGEDGAGPDCEEDADGELPDGVEWLGFDNDLDASELFSMADGVFATDWNSGYGVYNLNTEEIYGGIGADLEHPGRLVAVQARWGNLSGALTPATLGIYPDFGDNGYSFDIEHPHTTITRCVQESEEGEWVTYVLPEPILLSHPQRIWAAYHRASEADAPELMMENFYQEAEPWFAGARFPNIDPSIYYLGMHSPFYTWQVRLGVIYEEDTRPARLPFSDSAALSASSRVSWGDYDNDGDDDVMSSGLQLFRNNGDGSFTEVTSAALPATADAGGGVWGDYDNDGCLDFFGQSNADVLLHNNCDGTFADVTAVSGITDMQDLRDCDGDGMAETSPTEGSAWFDLDNDGLLDLYLANYECSAEGDDYFQNYNDFVWRNNGDGTFSDWTEASGIPQTERAGRGVTTGDPDEDGDIDVFVSNYRLDPNFFLLNMGDGTLEDIAGDNGTRGQGYRGSFGHTIGSVFGDIDQDDDLDMVHANLAHPFYYHFSNKTQILVNDGAGIYADERELRGVHYKETHSNPTLFDADNDGDLDLFITAVYSTRDSDYFENDGAGNFSWDNYNSGLVVDNGWGAAAADYDQDGDVDLLAYSLYENNLEDPGRWLEVRAVGGAGAGGLSNRSAIGARVRVITEDRVLLRQVSGGSGTGVQDSMAQHFGLGEESSVSVRVDFPGGASVTIEGPELDTTLWVHEDGRSASGHAPPGW